MTGTENPKAITMDANHSVTANFAQDVYYTLTVTADHGTVVKTPSAAQYLSGTVVSLQANADANYHFVNWTGDLTGTDNPKSITMDANHSVTANFAQDVYYTLTVTADHGTVVKTPGAAQYLSGTVVSLQANADTGYHFANWTGDMTGTDNPKTITMDADKTVTANFAINLNPAITSVDPPYGPPGTQVTITGDNFGDSRGAGKDKSGKGASYVSFNGVAATEYESWSNTEIVCSVPEGATPGPVTVVTAGGTSNTDMIFTVSYPTWYLAEGTCAWGFSTYITIENPNRSAVTAKITYMDPKAASGGKSGRPRAPSEADNPARRSPRPRSTPGTTLATIRTSPQR